MSKVGLARDAYKGSPKGLRSVSFEGCELPKDEDHWSWQRKNREHKLVTIRNDAWYRKKQTLIDSI